MHLSDESVIGDLTDKVFPHGMLESAYNCCIKI